MKTVHFNGSPERFLLGGVVVLEGLLVELAVVVVVVVPLLVPFKADSLMTRSVPFSDFICIAMATNGCSGQRVGNNMRKKDNGKKSISTQKRKFHKNR